MIKLEKNSKRKVVYENETYSINGNKNIKIHVSKQNGKVVGYEIYSDKDPFKVKESYDKHLPYYYFSNKIFDELKTKHFSEIQFNDFIIPFNGFKDDKEIDLDRVLCPYYSGHMVFCIKDSCPVSTIMIYDYIGGIENEHFHIDKALEHLKNNKCVLEVEKEEIPYYNRRANHTQGLKMKVLFDQKIFKKMWDYAKKFDFPTVIIKDMVCSYCQVGNGIDPLGIKKFVKTEKEIEKEHKDYEHEEYEENE